MSAHKRTSNKLTYEDAVQVHLMIMDGWIQSRIAAHFGTNQGRVSEVNTGKAFPGSYEEARRRRSEAAE
jgi:transcriptional regulator